jgi:ribosomal protein L21E
MIKQTMYEEAPQPPPVQQQHRGVFPFPRPLASFALGDKVKIVNDTNVVNNGFGKTGIVTWVLPESLSVRLILDGKEVLRYYNPRDVIPVYE